MARPGSNDLGGAWTGHYEQDGARHPISMSIVQRGAAFAGRMVDGDTVFFGAYSEDELGEIVDQTGLTPSDEQGFAFSLPQDSTVDGVVDGTRIEFVKTYRGMHSMDAWIGDAEFHLTIEDHRVRYSGVFDAVQDVIRGRWQIGAEDDQDAFGGGFELRRAGTDETPGPAG